MRVSALLLCVAVGCSGGAGAGPRKKAMEKQAKAPTRDEREETVGVAAREESAPLQMARPAAPEVTLPVAGPGRATDSPPRRPGNETEERPVREWIEIIEGEAKAQYAKETKRFAELREAVGWAMPGLSCRSHERKKRGKEIAALETWVREDGYRVLSTLLEGGELSEAEKPYRVLALGLYLRAGVDYAKTDSPKGRCFYLDLSKLPGGRDACLAYRTKVNTAGIDALYKGYTTGGLNARDVDAIRLYRIAQGQRGVGEAFLPIHLGLSEANAGKSRHRGGGGHDKFEVTQYRHGKKLVDVRLARLEHVLKSPRYSDVLDTAYHLTFSLRPEGVNEFLTYLSGYEPVKNRKGQTYVRLKPEHLKRKPGERAEDWVHLGERVGEKPVVLYINDPIDGPVSEAFPAFETIYQAYRDQADIFFVAVDIHDWYYSGMSDQLSGGWNGRRPNIHSYNREERARKARNRYVESPHATFPCLVGDDYQSVKNFYGTGGGANHWIVIDRDGRIAEYAANQHGNMNDVENDIRRVLENGGRMSPASKKDYGRADHMPGLSMPEPMRVRIHDAEVVSVDARGRGLVVKKGGLGAGGIDVRLTSHARLSRDETVARLADVRPGERVAIDFYLDDYAGGAKIDVQELEKAMWKGPSRKCVIDGDSMTVKLHGHYGRMRRRWVAEEATRMRTVPARGVRVLSTNMLKSSYGEPGVMWMSARVTAVDARAHRITVKRTPLSEKDAKGYAFYTEITKAGRKLNLTTTAKLRMAEVENWLRDARGTITVLADDAVDYCLNGRFGGGFDDIAPGDFVGVRYYPDRQRGGALAPHTIRISKPIGR